MREWMRAHLIGAIGENFLYSIQCVFCFSFQLYFPSKTNKFTDGHGMTDWYDVKILILLEKMANKVKEVSTQVEKWATWINNTINLKKWKIVTYQSNCVQSICHFYACAYAIVLLSRTFIAYVAGMRFVSSCRPICPFSLDVHRAQSNSTVLTFHRRRHWSLCFHLVTLQFVIRATYAPSIRIVCPSTDTSKWSTDCWRIHAPKSIPCNSSTRAERTLANECPLNSWERLCWCSRIWCNDRRCRHPMPVHLVPMDTKPVPGRLHGVDWMCAVVRLHCPPSMHSHWNRRPMAKCSRDCHCHRWLDTWNRSTTSDRKPLASGHGAWRHSDHVDEHHDEWLCHLDCPNSQ